MDGPMMIRIRDDAGGRASGLLSPDWKRMMQAIQGQWIEVETDHLFEDQFNTVPIPGVSESGLRVMESDVAEIRNDARAGKSKCGWCGAVTSGAACGSCGKPAPRPLVPGSEPDADELEEQWGLSPVEPGNRPPAIDIEEQWASPPVEPRRGSYHRISGLL